MAGSRTARFHQIADVVSPMVAAMPGAAMGTQSRDQVAAHPNRINPPGPDTGLAARGPAVTSA